MGIYGALQTAVTGMAAQSFALENISGNIANSQTTGYKRMETGFIDLIPDAAVGRQVPGAVLAYSRSTNDVRGDIVTSPTGTHVALNGSGFFVVAEKSGTSDGQSVFGDANYYTRRGDFEMDREGYLRNGAGYYLKGVPINTSTGNVSGSVPQMIKVSNGLIPAQVTQRINYELNLPDVPSVGLVADFATVLSDATLPVLSDSTDLVTDLGMTAGDELTIAVGGGATQTYTLTGGDTLGDLRTWLEANAPGVTASIDDDGRFRIAANDTDDGFVLGGAVAIDLGSDGTEAAPPAPETRSDFVDRTVDGGAITVYSPNGAAVSVEMRWGKVSNEPDTWRMYYLSDSEPEAWTQVPGAEFTFDKGLVQTHNGQTISSTDTLQLNLSSLTVNDVVVGDVELNLGEGGLTQFDNANGRASVSTLSQDGYPAGTFMSVSINDSGRVVATYSNGKQIELYQLITANFNAENQLKRLDGGIYSSTAASGEAIYSTDGGVTGGALESSNTDISEEFTKLIVTQQAYAAGTRIVSTSDEMLQEALNMLR